MTALHHLELTQLAGCLRRREVSPVEVTRAQLNRIAALDGSLGSYARVTPEEALVQAERAESEIAAGRYRGTLHGVPIGIKDLLWVKGVVSAAGMAIYRDFQSAEDATVVARLKQAGRGRRLVPRPRHWRRRGRRGGSAIGSDSRRL